METGNLGLNSFSMSTGDKFVPKQQDKKKKKKLKRVEDKILGWGES